MYYCCICKFLKELLSIVSFETWCKGKDFHFYLPNFFESFFDLFFQKSLPERPLDIRLDLPTSSLGISISDFLSPPSSCHHRISLDCGCKSTAVKHILQMFSQLFFTLLDCQRFINALFFVLLLSTPFFISPSQIINFQSSIINFQKAGVFLSFHAGFSAKDAGFFPFYAYLLTMSKFTLHFFDTLLKNSTDKISLTKRLYILPLQR